MGFSPVGLGFRGRETETDLPKLVSCGEDPLPTAEVVESTGVESILVRSPDGFGQP